MKPEEKATATPATGTQHEHLLQSIWDHSLDALLLTAPDGRIFAANPAACRLFDRTEAEICRLGRNGLLDLTDPNLAAALADRERLDQAQRELTCLRADGSRFTGEVTSAIFTDAAGQTRTSMIIRDVTERKRAEEEQREREAQYRSLFENSLMGISQALPNGRLIHVNQAYAEMYGYTNPAELMAEVTYVGQGLYAHPDDRKEVRRILSEKGVMEPREITVVRRDGSRFVVLVAAREIRDAAGKLLFYQAEHVDITARKRAEEALRQREAELNEAQRVSHVGNWLWEAATDAVTWSEEIYRIFGLDPTQRVPRLEDHQRILSPESWARLKPAMENTRQTGAPYELDLELVRPDGTKRWINARGEAVRDASGRVVRLRGTAHDITERKQAEAYREMGRGVLQILNEPGDLQASIQQALAVLQTRTGCDAVGLRLQDGDDFPYCAQLGFSKDFLLKENTLIGRAADGGVCRDPDGNVSLECTCGLILSGKTDPANPLFTRGGSFWTNDAFLLLDIPPGEDPRFHPRNECIHQGYASMALVPIRNKNRIMGLLQFNDRRKGCFTLDSVELLEEIAAHIGGALMRMRTEEALRASEELYRGLFESSRDAIMTLEPPSWKFTSGNPAAVKMFGAQNEKEFVTHGPWALSPERQPDGRASAEKAMEMIETALREGSHFFAWTHRRIGGEEFPADVLLTRTERAGKMIVQATVRDITERKQAEDELRRASAEWEQTFNAMPDLIMVLNREHRIVQANQSMVTRLGQGGAGLFGRRCYEVVHGTDAPPDFCPHTALLRDGQAHTIETTEGRIGGTFVVSDTPLCDARGAVWGAVHVARDITEHKRAAESQTRLATAVEQAAEAIVITDIEGTIIYTNPAFEKITGYPRQEVYGHIWHFLRSGTHTVAFFQKIWAVLQAGQVWRGRLINKRKDGMLYEEDVTISPVLNAAGQLINYVAIKRDVTREVALETQIRQNAKMAAVGQLAGGVAHDFNNKLQIILFSVELLLKDMPRKHPFRADLQDIQEAARRSIDLTRQLLTFSRQQPITPKVLDLNAALAGSLKMLGRSIGENIRLTFTAQQELWNVSMDPGQLDQVLANLTVNARDAIAGAGLITIAAANRTLLAAECQDKPDFVPPGDYVELTVRDTGAGMTPDIQARIFEPFFTTKEVGKGTGLGLATVYGIVKQNNGGIAVQSTVGQGTTFSIYLPRSREAVLADTQTAAARSSTGTETILLVEDEERILDLAKRVLTKQGYQVVTALAPAEAVRLCASSPAPFHLLLTDVIMPGMSGLELAERLQKLQPGIRVLYMSGYTAGIMKQHGHLPEGTQVLQKPFTGESLTQHVRAALDAPPASRRNASLPFVSRFRSWWTGYGRV